jgi:integrase
MPTIDTTIEAFLASKNFDAATISRLGFWSQQFSHKELSDISEEDVDNALVTLSTRGKMIPVRKSEARVAFKPLSGATLNRYVSQLGSLYKYAKRLRLLPRSFTPPTAGVEKYPEMVDPERYLRPEQVDALIKVSRLLDTRYKRMTALITMAYHTGLRVGSLMALRWDDVDLVAGTAHIVKTKNGDPITAALSQASVAELQALPVKTGLVFAGQFGQPYNYRRLWNKICEDAGLKGRNFHQLRHGCGYAMAKSGVNQAQIMAVMGHKTLTASARYMHSNVSDKADVVAKVFG